jgi:polyisoprenoid-binding protein YceI
MKLARRPRAASFLALALLSLSLPLGAQQAPAPTPAPTPARPAAAPTGVQRFDLRTNGQSRVLFTSDAPLETVDGISTSTSGDFTVDLSNPSRQLTGRVEVLATTLRTGVDLRDEHLRGDSWLDAARFPNITLELTGTQLATPLAPNRPTTARVRGRFTLHGVTHDVTVPVTVRLIPLSGEYAGLEGIGINADMLRIQGEFHLALTNYGISVPTLLRLKVSNDIRVRVDLTAFRHG